MINNGFVDYWSDTGNYIDLIYIGSSLAMSQLHDDPDIGPRTLLSKTLMIIVATLAIRRTFSFLRIFKLLSPIVTMLYNVMYDLRIFFTFYFILVTLFSLVYGIIGLGNYNLPGKYRTEVYFKDPVNKVVMDENPGTEYHMVGQLIGNIINVIRVSLGDFGLIAPSVYLEDENENMAFWVLFFLTLIITNIIFLNFIVAEASASYAEVSEKLENYI
mmetsp:Transcript_2923/g.4509  ORF Transcript_2923/g.4509 Transcript_2923/m.4509 type:complete len:216 (-) Transcript_2923:148-795(-)